MYGVQNISNRKPFALLSRLGIQESQISQVICKAKQHEPIICIFELYRGRGQLVSACLRVCLAAL